MARNDDYLTNIEGNVSPFKVIIDGVGYSLYPGKSITGKYGPQENDKQLNTRETPITFDDFSNGMGWSYRLVPNTYAFAIDGYCRTPRMFMPGGKLTEISLDDLGWTVDELGLEIRCAIDFGGDVIIGAGSNLIRLVGGEGDPVQEYFLGTGVQVDSALVYNTIPLFSTDNMFDNWRFLTGYSSLDSAWITAYDSAGAVPDAENPRGYADPVYFQKMIKVFEEIDGTGGFRFIGNDTPITYTNIQSTDFDTIIGNTTAYGASIACGDTTYEIKQMIASDRVFYIVKVDGVYGIESSGLYCPDYTPDWKGEIDINNGASAAVIFGRIFVGTSRGVEMIDVSNRQRNDESTLISPSYKLANETPIFGLPVTMHPDSGWLSTFIYNGTDSHLCYLAPRDPNINSQSPNPIIWHGSECTIPNERVTMQFKTSVNGIPHMLIGTHDGTRMHLYTLSISNGSPIQDFLSGGHHEFSTESKLYLPFQDWQDANAKKIVRRYDSQIEYLTVPIIDPTTGDITSEESRGEVNVFATADTGSRVFFETVTPDAVNSEWSFQGVVSASPKATMVPSQEATEGTQIGILLDGTLINVGTDEDPIYKPFVIRSVKVRAEVIVEQVQEKIYPVVLGHYMMTAGSTRDFADALTKFAALTILQNSGPVDMIDELGKKVVVKIEPGLNYEIRPERTTQEFLIILEVVVSVLGETFHWDLDQTYDTVFSWSN